MDLQATPRLRVWETTPWCLNSSFVHLSLSSWLSALHWPWSNVDSSSGHAPSPHMDTQTTSPSGLEDLRETTPRFPISSFVHLSMPDSIMVASGMPPLDTARVTNSGHILQL